MPTPRFRRAFRRALVALLLLTVVAVAAFGIFYYRLTRRGLPTTAGEVAVAGLADRVDVRRDRWGVPHVRAGSMEDLSFAQGYVTAQDRLWQMDLLRRDGSGRLAELVGTVAYDRDVKHRTLGLRLAAERALTVLPPAHRATLEAYARGVNAYVDSHRDSLPLEFGVLRYAPEPWTPVDSIVIGKLMAETLGTTYQNDLMRADFASLDPQTYADLFVERSPYDEIVVGSDAPATDAPPTPAATPGVARLTGGDEALVGSNNWVVAGSRSADGHPLLANDPHLALNLPPIWYATHLSTRDGAVDVAGVTFPGAPGITIGHNRRIAWGVTNFGPDVQDLYVETFDESGRRYRVGDEWRDVEVRPERITVRREGLEPAYDVRDVDVLVTRHGPIVRDEGAKKYALRWTALDTVAELSAFLGLDVASSWDDARAALATYPGPAQNFVYADVDGHIGYYAAGNIPIRRTGTGETPYDGASDAGDWLGYIPFDRLPHVLDPPDGFVVTANNRTVGTSTPEFYTHEWISPFRARRIEDRLRADARLTPDTMNAIQNDAYSYPDAIFARVATDVARRQVATGAANASDWNELADRVAGWDGQLSVDSVPAAIVVTMRKQLFDRVLAAKLGDRAGAYAWFSRETLYTNLIEQQPNRWLPTGVATWDDLILESYGAAKRTLAEKLGADPANWRYGRLNTFSIGHPLGKVPGLAAVVNVEPFEIAGGQSAIKAIGVLRGWGPSMRLVVDVGDFDRTTLVLPAGESGQPASPHYTDQLADWRDGRTHPFPFTDGAVDAATVETLVLAPSTR